VDGPLLFIYIRNTKLAFWFVLSTIAFRLILHVILIRTQPISCERLWVEYLYLYLPNQLSVFGMGILLYFIIKDDYSFSVSPTMILMLSIILTVHVIGSPIGWPLLGNHVLFSGAFLVLCIAVSKYEFRMLVNPVMIHIGKVSYSMYLVHFAVFHWLNEWGLVDFIQTGTPARAMLNFMIRFLVVMILTTGISTFFYRAVELPTQQAGKKLIELLNRRKAHPSY
jgi:peptidoglycan/LPS O-acetylase OafA/YrhL